MAIYNGSVKISKIYLGSNLVFQESNGGLYYVFKTLSSATGLYTTTDFANYTFLAQVSAGTPSNAIYAVSVANNTLLFFDQTATQWKVWFNDNLISIPFSTNNGVLTNKEYLNNFIYVNGVYFIIGQDYSTGTWCAYQTTNFTTFTRNTNFPFNYSNNTKCQLFYNNGTYYACQNGLKSSTDLNTWTSVDSISYFGIKGR